MAVDDALGNRQAQPASLLARMRRAAKERIEDAGEIRFRNTGAAIAHRNHDPLISVTLRRCHFDRAARMPPTKGSGGSARGPAPPANSGAAAAEAALAPIAASRRCSTKIHAPTTRIDPNWTKPMNKKNFRKRRLGRSLVGIAKGNFISMSIGSLRTNRTSIVTKDLLGLPRRCDRTDGPMISHVAGGRQRQVGM